MTPETWAALGGLVERFGLPLAMLAVFGWLTIGEKSKLVGREVAEAWRHLYERERQDRIAAQKDVAEVASASAKVAETAERAVGLVTNAYEERLAGRRGPRG